MPTLYNNTVPLLPSGPGGVPGDIHVGITVWHISKLEGECQLLSAKHGGGQEIRTLETLSRLHAFQAVILI
tara:strand:+ start:154038 stop:154250 length:213 start_codon:yes stop_codon:yes gene_type:complete